MKRNYLFMLIMLCAFIFAPNDAYAAYYDEHTGDSWEDAYIIDSAEDLQEMHNRNRTINTDSEKYFKIGNDINIEVTDWTESYWGYIQFFNGYLDGQNHTINVKFSDSNTDYGSSYYHYHSTALFGIISATSKDIVVIKDLNVSGTIQSRQYAAGIAYYMSSGTIDHCSFAGSIEVTGYRDASNDVSIASAGGLFQVISTNVIVKNCNFNGSITVNTANTSYGYAAAGGIVAEIASPVLNNDSENTTAVIDNCTASSSSIITANATNSYSSWAGGITGFAIGGIIQNCASDATISSGYAGGILGLAYPQDVTNDSLTYRMRPVLTNNRYTGADKEIGEFGTGYNTNTPNTPNSPTTPTTPTVRNNNVINDLELASLDADYEAYIRDPKAYFSDLGFDGHIPDPINLSHLSDNPVIEQSGLFSGAADFPSSYNNRVGLPAIRNQGNYSTCWAFAALGAMEVNYVKNHAGSAPDLSELHLAWFVFEDTTSGHKFNYHDSDKSTLNQGGFAIQPIAFLTRTSGATQESALSYTQAESVQSVTSGKKAEDYPLYMRVKEIYSIGDVDYNTHRDDVKRLITDCGGVLVAYHHNKIKENNVIIEDLNCYNSSTHAYYENTSNRSGHMVLLVGWDDNFPRTNFATQPEHDGAWLARNSWGTAWGDSGYFWIAYDQPLKEATAYEVSDIEQNFVYYGYDGLGRTEAVNCEYSANIFQVKNNSESFKGVAFYTMDNNASYTVSIYDWGAEQPVMTPIKGTPVWTEAGTFPRAGFHTIDVSSNISFTKGNYFTVVLKLDKTKNGKQTAIEETSYIKGDVVVNRGESLFSKNGTTWADGINTSAIMEGNSSTKTSSMNACIKAFTVSGGGGNNNGNSGGGGGGGGGCNASGLGVLCLVFASLIILNRRSMR